METTKPQRESMKRLALFVLAFLPSCAPAPHAGPARADDQAARRTVSSAGQHDKTPVPERAAPTPDVSERRFRNRADSLAWVSAKNLADRSSGFRLIVSLQDKRLWAVVGEDTVLNGPVAKAKGTTFKYG